MYKLLSIGNQPAYRGGSVVYKFLDIKTEQVMEYTWGMFRDRLKYAPTQAQILYNEQDSEIKTSRENI